MDPEAWLRAPWDGYLAGFLAYEFAWELLDIHAERPRHALPRLWVGRFTDRGQLSGDRGQFAGGTLRDIQPRQTQSEYEAAVTACVDAIYNGELFEVNYTGRWDAHWSGECEALFDALGAVSTGDYFGLLRTDDFAVASVSPESFIEVRGDTVVTRPIKGTARRSEDPVEDARLSDQLRVSEKDRAENIMIVDLMRNDLTKVCDLGTVVVDALCEVESFAGVHHLVSTVRGVRQKYVRPIEVLLGCFPAGSITGAPKLRAIELAAELEVGARGPYTGTMFVATPTSLDSSVLIRTAAMQRADDGWRVEYGAGGAIVSSSDPASEWGEALTKCGPLVRAAELRRA